MKKNQFLLLLFKCFIFSSMQAMAYKGKFQNNSFQFSFNPAQIRHSNSIVWPLVYPNRYKAILNIGTQRNKFANGNTAWGLSFGASFEMLWEQTLFYGLGYQYSSIPKTDTLDGGTIHRVSLQTGIIIQLDDYERHHLLIHLRPGIALLKSKEVNASAFGIGLGIGYDYCINSDFVIAPEVIYNWYPAISDSPYRISGWNIGCRISFGR